MITACHSCKINEEIERFSAFVQGLNTSNPKVQTAVETLRRYYLGRCKGCERTSQDDIRIHKTPHTRTEMVAATPTQEPARGVTRLPEDVENTLRVAMSSFWGLTQVQLLCVHHLMNGRRLSSFGDALRKVHEQIRKYRGSERAQAGMMRDAIARRIPILAPIINAHVDDQGEATGKVVNMMDDEPTGDLFEAAGIEVPFDPLERRTKR